MSKQAVDFLRQDPLVAFIGADLNENDLFPIARLMGRKGNETKPLLTLTPAAWGRFGHMSMRGLVTWTRTQPAKAQRWLTKPEVQCAFDEAADLIAGRPVRRVTPDVDVELVPRMLFKQSLEVVRAATTPSAPVQYKGRLLVCGYRAYNAFVAVPANVVIRWLLAAELPGETEAERKTVDAMYAACMAGHPEFAVDMLNLHRETCA